MATLLVRECDDVIVPALFDAAADKDERTQMVATCAARNAIVDKRAQELLAKVKQEVDYGAKIRSTPRGLNPACVDRMNADFRRIEELRSEIERDKLNTPSTIPFRLVPPLISTKSCVNCADDRAACETARSELREAEQEVRDYVLAATKLK